MRCDVCERGEYDDMPRLGVFRVYATYNGDHGENVHPLHARYPSPMARVCEEHLVGLLLGDNASPTSTRQWLIVAPASTGEDT